MTIPDNRYCKCESPIERIMLDALERVVEQATTLGYVFDQQTPVSPYRLDFSFVHADGRKLNVEVDGHDFHERTPEQAGWDRKRDRYLQFAGWRVIRFTGSEVAQNASACASEVSEHLQQMSAIVSEETIIAISKRMLRLTTNTEDKERAKQERHDSWRKAIEEYRWGK